MSTVTPHLHRRTVVIALLVTLFASMFANGQGASAAGGPYLPDLAVSDACRIYGPEGPPRIRIKIANIGNDVATNRVAITVRATLGQSGLYAIQHPEQAVTLQPGQSFAVTVTLTNRILSDLIQAPEVQAKLSYVANGHRKPMEEHSTTNNRLPFTSYLDLPGC
ncbi:MAG: hypothetical protein QOF01_4082 [Thermomicrobiales bacterium]|jgi:hypothetical protein|nr:hypothetical protein [Thermomicrobiales bacterium]